MSDTHAYRAFRIHADEHGHRAGLETLESRPLLEGEVRISAHYSSVNYKDALAGTGRGKILRRSPLTGGIDVAGVIAESRDPRYQPGDAVLVTGCGLSEVHDGGYAEEVQVPGDWVISLPNGLSMYEAMVIGTAGFTAALAIQRMEDNRLTPAHGPIAVTGASGGVGSLAIDMLATGGYAVTAISGRPQEADYLKSLGASEVLDRATLELGGRPLEKALWGGAVDNVGGELLAWLTRTVKPWGSIAAIGLVGGHGLHTTVMPFILRGVSLLGINSADCPVDLRRRAWARIASDLRPRHLDRIAGELVGLQELPGVFDAMLAGRVRGRTVVRLRQGG